MTYPEIGERFVGILLKTVFGRKFKHLSVTAQKVYYGADTSMRGARLDVYMEAKEGENSEGKATVYDVEADRNNDRADRKSLPRRVRFYHGKIVARGLDAGVDYDGLKNVVIVMIMPYDPFGLNRMMYTVKNRCVEEPEMEYEDGAGTIFLYTKGTKEVPNEALKQLLHYMESTVLENAVNDDLREIHRIVEIVKKDPEMSIRYLRYIEELNRKKKEGEKAGDLQRLISQVCKKIRKDKLLEEIAEDLEEEVSVIEPIYNIAKEFAPDYDLQSILERMNTN